MHLLRFVRLFLANFRKIKMVLQKSSAQVGGYVQAAQGVYYFHFRKLILISFSALAKLLSKFSQTMSGLPKEEYLAIVDCLQYYFTPEEGIEMLLSKELVLKLKLECFNQTFPLQILQQCCQYHRDAPHYLSSVFSQVPLIYFNIFSKYRVSS